MHVRRLAALLLGAWMAGSLLMLAVAASNLRGVDRLLASPAPAAARILKTAGGADVASLLRYEAAELSRRDYRIWEWTQLGLGALLFAVLIPGSQGRRTALLMCVLMLLAVVIMRVYLTPELERLGHAIDFVPAARPTPDRDRFWNFHLAYTGLEGIKLGLALVLGVTLLRRSRRRAAKPDRDPRWVRAR